MPASYRCRASIRTSPAHVATAKRSGSAGYHLASRVEAAEQRARELPPNAKRWRKPPVADEAKFKALQARAAELGKTLPSDKTMEGAQKLLAAFPNCITPIDQPGQSEARQELLGKPAGKQNASNAPRANRKNQNKKGA